MTGEKSELTGSLCGPVVDWDFDSGDSVGKSASQSIAAYKKIKPGSPVIALNHEASLRTSNPETWHD